MTDKFKSKGTAILHGSNRRPNSVGDFLKDIAEEPDKTVGLHKPPKAQLHKTTDIENIPNIESEILGRLHIAIRQDLADRLFEMVYQRKRNPNIKGRASTQRAIIEEALDAYFKAYQDDNNE